MSISSPKSSITATINYLLNQSSKSERLSEDNLKICWVHLKLQILCSMLGPFLISWTLRVLLTNLWDIWHVKSCSMVTPSAPWKANVRVLSFWTLKKVSLYLLPIIGKTSSSTKTAESHSSTTKTLKMKTLSEKYLSSVVTKASNSSKLETIS